MSSELQLRGHGRAVCLLTTVPTGDGRTLLVSGETAGRVRVWDPLTGESVAGPVTVDKVALRELAMARLGADGGWTLVTCGARSVRLWQPATLRGAGSLPRRVGRRGVDALVVLPATAATPELIVTVDRREIRVTDAASSRAVFAFTQPRDYGGEIGNRVHSLVALRLDDSTPGFAAVRYGGIEVWAAVRGTWQRHDRDELSSLRGDDMTFLTGERGEPWLAVAHRQGVDVWDLRTGQRTVRGDLGVRVTRLTPVPLGGRTALALGGQNHDAGVRIWDPSTGRTLSGLFNGHGPVECGTLVVDALTAIAGPDGTVRVASAANDGTIRISPPFSSPDDIPPERLPDLSKPEWVRQRAAQSHAAQRNRAERLAERADNMAQVTVGMPMQAVAGLLGPPDDRTTLADALQNGQWGGTISGSLGERELMALMQDREFWYYGDVPREGMSTMIAFAGDRVVDVNRQSHQP